MNVKTNGRSVSAYYGHYDIVKMLLDNGSDPTWNDCWSMRISHIRSHYETSNLIIFSKQGINLEDKSFWGHFLDLFIHPIESVLRLINPRPLGNPLIYEPRDLNRIYITRSNGKAISAIVEPDVVPPFLAINYTGFNQDICIAIDEYDDAKFGGGSIECIKDGNQYNVYTQGTKALSMWTDLTSKTRIQ